MTLRRPYADRLFFLFFGGFLLAGTVLLAGLLLDDDLSWAGWLYRGVAALFALWLGIFSLRYAVLPFRIDIDRLGWTVRTPDLDRYLRWDEIDKVAIAPGPKRSERLIVVPATGVTLDVRHSARATLDDRPAVELFRLGEVAYDDGRLARDLAELAGDRFQNRVARLTLPLGRQLSPFPGPLDHARLRRWLNRRTALLFTGWYLLVLLPALAIVDLAATAHELLGAVVLVAALIGVAAALIRAATIFSDSRRLAHTSASIDGPYLVTSAYDIKRRIPLQSGEVAVLPPGSKRGYGKAWLLTDTTPCLLLSSPHTGHVRSADDLRMLSATLSESPHDSDRAAALELDRLATSSLVTVPLDRAQLSPAPASPAPVSSASASSASASPAQISPVQAGTADGANLWLALTAIGRVVGWLAVVATIALAGGTIVDNSSFVGPALILGAAALFGVWILYALYRILGLLGALMRFAGRAFYARG
ncbi:hypothetical protein ACQPZX_12435 [Actinoplanes sp. CA-142083]|uniref:hypothetical protein n=1 Tax=Actinoplanes sp. CA-142083 TaxID=3239903 RepID=UPI003D93FDF5